MIELTVKWIRLRVEYELESVHDLDFFIPTIRGAFGYSLYESHCRNRLTKCPACNLKSSCLYFRVFESDQLGKNADAHKVHPYQISEYIPPVDDMTGKKLNFYFTFFGKEPQKLYPLIISELKRMGNTGFGKKMNKAVNMNIYDSDDTPLYKKNVMIPVEPKVMNINSILKMVENIDGKINNMKIKFISPTQLEKNREYLKKIDFRDLINSIARRLNMIEKQYGDGTAIDKFNISFFSDNVTTVEKKYEFFEHKRFSTRKKVDFYISGITGYTKVEGDLSRSLPLLILGEIFHIGAKTTFGLGQYLVFN